MRRMLLFGMMVMAIGCADPEVVREKSTAYAHVVVFRMKKDAPKDAVEKAIADCHEMLTKIPSVHSLRAGRPAAKGTPDVPKMEYDFALLVLVENADGLAEYIKHPLHLKFIEKHGAHFDREKLQIFDFLDQSK